MSELDYCYVCDEVRTFCSCTVDIDTSDVTDVLNYFRQRIAELETEVNYKEEFDALCARFVEANERIAELEARIEALQDILLDEYEHEVIFEEGWRDNPNRLRLVRVDGKEVEENE